MIKLAVTGNIATGKTLVESFLSQEGVPVIDADEINRDLLKYDKETIQEVYDLFIPTGVNVKDNDGTISRDKVKNIVFKDRKLLKSLENIIHPRVIAMIDEFFNINKDKPVVAAFIPLLYETGMEKMFDKVLLVIADRNTQIKRLMKRDNLSPEDAQRRIDLQMPQEEKVKKADFIIDNSGSPENTQIQLREILSKLRTLV